VPCKNHPEQVIDLVHCSRCGEEFCRDCVVELKGQLFCATCKREQVRDIQSGADGTTLELASIWRRFVALLLDGLIVGIPLGIILVVYVFSIFDSGIGPSSAEAFQADLVRYSLLFALVPNVIYLVYEGMMLQARGQTLGKMALGIKVVTPEGNDISAGQAWGRPFVRMVFYMANMFFGLIFLINYLPAFFSKEKKTVHDAMAKTRVIKWSA
jgi:uncharacterized RDD family membrane protein YckC